MNKIRTRTLGPVLTAAGFAVALAAVLLGTSTSAGAATTTAGLSWLTSAGAPQQLYDAGVPTTWNPTWAIMNTGACMPTPENAEPAYWFGDYDTFANAVSDGEIAGSTPTPNCSNPTCLKNDDCPTFKFEAVVVDYEDWTNTPLVERQQWQTYVQMAYTLAHSHGLKVIQAMTHGVPANSGCPNGWSGYFLCDAAGYEARYADFVDIQAQQEEADLSGQPGSFNYEVNTGAAQAKAANPDVVVLAGMRSSFTAGDGTCTQVPAQTIIDDWDSVAADANGAWLNTNCDASTFAPLLEQLYG